jgi:hypothetical protein
MFFYQGRTLMVVISLKWFGQWHRRMIFIVDILVQWTKFKYDYVCIRRLPIRFCLHTFENEAMNRKLAYRQSSMYDCWLNINIDRWERTENERFCSYNEDQFHHHIVCLSVCLSVYLSLSSNDSQIRYKHLFDDKTSRKRTVHRRPLYMYMYMSTDIYHVSVFMCLYVYIKIYRHRHFSSWSS